MTIKILINGLKTAFYNNINKSVILTNNSKVNILSGIQGPSGAPPIWGNIAGNIENQTDLQSEFALYIPLAEKANPNGVATLDSGGKVPANQIPFSSITEVFAVNSIAEMLALPATVGDVAVVNALPIDGGGSYILQNLPPSILGNWVLLIPPGNVTSVNGQIGIVNLNTDNIPEGATNLYFTAARTQAIAEAIYYTIQEISVSQIAIVNYWYVCNNSSVVVLTLPGVAAFGDKIKICGKGAGGWKIAQNAGQVIHYGTLDSTIGTGGSLSSQKTFDCVELVCISPNTDWLVHNSQGNLTII